MILFPLHSLARFFWSPHLFFSAAGVLRWHLCLQKRSHSLLRGHFLRVFRGSHAMAFIFPLSRCHRRHSQALDCPEDVSEQFSRNCHLRHLEDHLPGVAHNLRPDLDQFLPQRGQRPVTHGSWQHRLTQKVPQVVCQNEQQQPHLIIHKVMARKPHPSHRIFAFLDPLLSRSPLIIKPHHRFADRLRLVTMNPMRGNNSPLCHSTLATTRRAQFQLCA